MNNTNQSNMRILRIIGIVSTVEFTYHYFQTATDQPQKYICLVMVALSVTLATFKRIPER